MTDRCSITDRNYDEDFGWEYYTDCSDIPISTTSSPKSFSTEYKYCPFCGKELDFSELHKPNDFVSSFNNLCEMSNLANKQIETLVKNALGD